MSRVRRSLLLSAADSYIGTALQLVSTVVIARLLTPAEIGIFAIAAVFAALATMFRDFGIAEYMIQERELTTQKIAAALSLNILASWLMFAGMFFGAPLAAAFYRNPEIADAMRVIACNFLLIPFGAVSMAYFRRELDFVPNLICNLAGNIVGFLVSVVLALKGWGYMSLAWSSLASTAVVVSAAVWFRPPGFPRWPSLKGIGEVFHFSKFASGIYIFAQMGKGAPEMIIGRASSVVDVAIFSRASGLVELFHRAALRPVTRVCMPYFADSDRNGVQRAEAYTTSVTSLTAVGWPVLLLLALVAEPAIRLVYGPQWLASVPLARVVCLACALELMHMLAREVLLATGQARRANRLQLELLALQVCGLFLVVPFGLTGAAWGLVASSCAGLVVSQLHLRQGIGLTVSHMVSACSRSLALAGLSLAAPVAWLLLEGVALASKTQFAVVGAGLVGLVWLISLRLLNHPLYPHVSRLLGALRLRGRAPAASAAARCPPSELPGRINDSQ